VFDGVSYLQCQSFGRRVDMCTEADYCRTKPRDMTAYSSTVDIPTTLTAYLSEVCCADSTNHRSAMHWLLCKRIHYDDHIRIGLLELRKLTINH